MTGGTHKEPSSGTHKESSGGGTYKEPSDNSGDNTNKYSVQQNKIFNELKKEYKESIVLDDNHFMNHSSIEDYPPSVLNFPKFYYAHSTTYILYPGECLYIPKYWNHWVFTYQKI